MSKEEKTKNGKIKKVFVVIASLLVLILILGLLQSLLIPKTDVRERSMIAEYYEDTGNHNVIFVGDCEVYENISPVTIYEKTGLTSYVRGTSSQMVWQSYYILEDTFKYEKPDAVFLNVLSLRQGTDNDEAYNRMTIDGMKLSDAKIGAIKASMVEGESFLSYIFPILRYHSRWGDIGSEDFKYMFDTVKNTHSGYLMRCDVKPMTGLPNPSVLADYSLPEKKLEYLDKIVKLCKNEGVRLVLIKSPTLYPHWYEEWDKFIENYAKDNDLSYINFQKYAEDIGIDWETDTYDNGIHLNLYGAEKYSAFLAEKMLEIGIDYKDYNKNKEVKNHWSDILEGYYDEKSLQEEWLATHDSLKGLYD